MMDNEKILREGGREIEKVATETTAWRETGKRWQTPAASEAYKYGNAVVSQCNERVRNTKRAKTQWNGIKNTGKEGKNPENSHPGQLSIFQPKIRKFPRKYFLVWDYWEQRKSWKNGMNQWKDPLHRQTIKPTILIETVKILKENTFVWQEREVLSK